MAGTMYALKPVFNLDASVDLPECMYKLPILQVSKSLAGGSDHEELPPGILAALEARQESILSKLASLREELNQYRASIGLSASPATAVKGATADVVIRCSPTHPAYALPAIVNLLSAKIKVHASCHTHSSVASLPPALSSFLPLTTVPRGEADLKITLIWSQVGRDCELMVTPVAQSLVKGEVNLLRYLARLFPGVIAYEDGSSAVDNLLDGVTGLLWALPKDRQPLLRTFAFKLEKSSYLGGESLNLADLALFSAVKQLGLDRDLQPEFRKWFTLISSKLTGQSGRRHRQSSSRKSWRSSRHSSRRYSEKEKTPQRSPHSGHPNHHKKGPSPDKKVHYEKPKQAAPAETKRKHKEATPTKATGKPSHNSKSCSGKTPLALDQNRSCGSLSKEQLFSWLDDQGLAFSNLEHPAVFTVEAMLPYLTGVVEGAICKNLFLVDKRRGRHYLLVAEHSRSVRLADVAKLLGAKELRLASEEALYASLGVRQGCVSPLALLSDAEEHAVSTVVVDSALLDEGRHSAVNFHPLVNSATTTMRVADFRRFLQLTGHTVVQF